MIKIDSKLPLVGDTIFSEMSQLARATQAINLGQGFPDFQPDSDLLEAVCNAIRHGPNQYAPMEGIQALREVIHNKVLAHQQCEYDTNTEITVTSGATEAVTATILALVHPGDEVIVIDPAYDMYAPVVQLAGGIVRRAAMLPPSEQHPGFMLDWNAVATELNPSTRLLILNFPHNPGGGVLTAEDLDALENLAQKYPFLLLSDEAYEHIVFDNCPYLSPVNRPSLAARCVLISSFAKTLHATGWKVGYCCAPVEISREIRKVHQFAVYSVNTAVQAGIAAYLQDSSVIAQLSAFYQRKRDRLVAGLQGSKFRPLLCEGTFFLLVDTKAVGNTSEKALAIRLTKEAGVASIPVSAFYQNPDASQANHHLLRLCFAKQDSTLDFAIERLTRV